MYYPAVYNISETMLNLENLQVSLHHYYYNICCYMNLQLAWSYSLFHSNQLCKFHFRICCMIPYNHDDKLYTKGLHTKKNQIRYHLCRNEYPDDKQTLVASNCFWVGTAGHDAAFDIPMQAIKIEIANNNFIILMTWFSQLDLFYIIQLGFTYVCSCEKMTLTVITILRKSYRQISAAIENN